jgi:hypothetical protein
MKRAGRASLSAVRLDCLIKRLVCERLKKARGNLYTIRVARICREITESDPAPPSCKTAVRRYLLKILRDAVVHELVGKKKHIVVVVSKAKELLNCREHEN